MTSHGAYFDRDYFMDGPKKGTVYRDYIATVRRSPQYREIAEALHTVFRPKRALEIGCATGIMVRYLNELGVEAHGIDVSEWAIENREHRNVKLGSAGELAYPDGYFDLVFSCHALEHLPDAVCSDAFSEMLRVGSAWQFHMLPMIGTPPYVGKRDHVIAELKKDPTHVQLHELAWWTKEFQSRGAELVEGGICFEHDNERLELTHGQFTCKTRSVGSVEMEQARWHWNRQVMAHTRLQAASKSDGANSLPPNMVVRQGMLSYANETWFDQTSELRHGLNLSKGRVDLVANVTGKPCTLRVALGEDKGQEVWANCTELYLSLKPGMNVVELPLGDFHVLRGNPKLSRVNRISFGGTAAECEVAFWLYLTGNE